MCNDFSRFRANRQRIGSSRGEIVDTFPEPDVSASHNGNTTGRNNVPACWDCCSRVSPKAYFLTAALAFGDLVAGLAFADLAGLAAFVVVLAAALAGAAFFVAIILGSFRGSTLGTGSENLLSLFGTQVRKTTRNRDTLRESDISSLKLTTDPTGWILEAFGDCVKQNLLKHNALSNVVVPQLRDSPKCRPVVTRRDTRPLVVGVKERRVFVASHVTHSDKIASFESPYEIVASMDVP